MGLRRKLGTAALLPILGLAACAQTPLGPTVQVLPGRHKTFEAFRFDNADCQRYAQGAVAGQAEAANNRAVGAAVLGTVLGAGLGAAVGGGRGAAVGAAAGAGLGTAGGAQGSAVEQFGIQGQYDNAFGQCMYGKGNLVAGLPDPDPEPVPVRRSAARRVVRAPARPPAAPAAASGDWVKPVSVE